MLAALTRLGQGPHAVLSLLPPAATAVRQTQWLQKADFAKGAAKPAAKTKSKAAKKAQDPGTSDTSTQKFLLALQPQEIADLELSSEEKAEAAKRSREYARHKMTQHRLVTPHLSFSQLQMLFKLAAVLIVSINRTVTGHHQTSHFSIACMLRPESLDS